MEEQIKQEEQQELNEETKQVSEEENEITKLQQEIERLNTELNESRNAYYKAYADTENERNRLNKENEMIKKYRAQAFLLEFLPILDNFERAIKDQNNDYQKLKTGIEMIHRQISALLEKEGVSEIESLNQEFDPNLHHAIATEQVEGIEANKVLEVFQKGYKLKDRVLRATMVKVSE